MKWLVRLTIVVLMMGVSGTAKASFLDHYFGGMYSNGCSYYGYGGGIISEVANWQLANRQLDVEERQLERMNQQGEQLQGAVYGVVVRDQSREIQHLRLENKQLLAEKAELKNQLTEMRKEVLDLRQMLREFMKQNQSKK